MMNIFIANPKILKQSVAHDLSAIVAEKLSIAQMKGNSKNVW